MNYRELAHQAVTAHLCRQDETELAALLTLVAAEHPRLIVEIGCDVGGSLYAWRGLGARVVGVSLGPEDSQWARVIDHGATVIEGDSHDPAVQAKLAAELDGQAPDFFFIDGDHSAAGCRQDWELALKLGARVAGFHDVSPYRLPGDPGVRAVFAEACKAYPSVMILNRADDRNPGAGVVWLT